MKTTFDVCHFLKAGCLITSVHQPVLAKESNTFPPSITVFVSFNLSSALFNTISSTVLLATRRITFTGLEVKIIVNRGTWLGRPVNKQAKITINRLKSQR